MDSFDLNLFTIVRASSLKSLGYTEDQLLEAGTWLFNWQMAGMLLGGILWGILGDRIGRRTVLFGSIVMYSVATAANGLVHDIHAYAWMRVWAGIGMAGELGAAITLVSERVVPELRGYATMLVASFGLLGTLTAGVVTSGMDWRHAYFLGGALGIALLFLRMSTPESAMFQRLHHGQRRGDVWLILGHPQRLIGYLRCVMLGIPVWFTQAVLIGFAKELTEAVGVQPLVVTGIALAYYAFGAALGDLLCGTLSQVLRSRKKALLAFMLFLLCMDGLYLSGAVRDLQAFYWLCLAIGIGTGYWAVFVTVAAEQFGTNLRATVATTVPNMVRGTSVLIVLGFKALKSDHGLIEGAAIVGVICTALSLSALFSLRETFARDLAFVEE